MVAAGAAAEDVVLGTPRQTIPSPPTAEVVCMLPSIEGVIPSPAEDQVGSE
jgi:hypothetical protein